MDALSVLPVLPASSSRARSAETSMKAMSSAGGSSKVSAGVQWSGQQPRRQRCARAQDIDLTLDDKEGNRLTQVRPGPACGTGQVPDAARRMGGEPEGAAMVVLLLMRQPFQQHRVALTAHLTKKGGGGKRRVGQRE